MIVKKELSTGTQIIMEKIPFVRSVTVGIWVKAGAVNENKSQKGISHFIEHMMFKGTQKRTYKDIAQDIDKIGAQINAFTGKENTCYYIKALDSHLEDASEVLFDTFFNSIFDKEEMEKEKQVIYEEIDMHEDSPEDDVHDLLYEAVFNGMPLASHVLGKKETIKNFSKESLLKYIEDNYSISNVVIAIAGNFEEKNVLAMCEKYFKALSKKPARSIDYSQDYKPTSLFKKKDIEQAHICLGAKGVKLDDASYYPQAVINNIIGGSMSSRLFQEIREKRGLAYAVYSYSTSYINDGIFAIYAGVNPANAENAVECISDELKKIKNDGITTEEFLSSKEQLKSNYIFSLESSTSRMFSIGRSQVLLGKVYSVDEILEKISKVSMEDIAFVADKIADASNYSSALLCNKEVKLCM